MKTTKRYYWTTIKIIKIEKLHPSNVGRDIEEWGFSCYAGRNFKW